MTEVCLGCLCDAMSGCNLTATCEGGACGLFRITWAYWVDGGKLSDGGSDESAWRGCSLDPKCAADTIQNYMLRYRKDCNHDGKIDCYDYAAIHKLGGFGCEGNVGQEFSSALDSCLRQYDIGFRSA